MIISLSYTLVILAANSSVFITSVAPIITAIVGAIFTYLGLRLNNRAKHGDQLIASQAQQYEGIQMAQQFMKDALEDAKLTILDLKSEVLELKNANAELKEELAKLTKIIREGEDE